MKVLVVGRTGQLASALLKSIPVGIEVLNPDRSELDLLNPQRCKEYVLDTSPDWLINAGAYTNVDQAEDNELEAFTVNCHSPLEMAQASQITKGKFLQISTDYVFGGDRLYAYGPKSLLKPINVYGCSKAIAEKHLRLILSPTNLMIIRTSWLYSSTGSNFVLNMLNHLKEHNEALAVADQYNSPTSVSGLAEACWQTVKYNLFGIHHWTDGAVLSAADFIDAIAEEAFDLRLLVHQRPVIRRICAADFAFKAPRPTYSVLDCSSSYEYFKLAKPDWRHNLRMTLKELI